MSAKANQTTVEAGRLRHVLSSGVSYIGTSMNCLTGSKPDYAHAIKMYDIGIAKVRNVINDLDQTLKSHELKSLEHVMVIEENFRKENHLVFEWTQKFSRYVQESRIFSDIEAVSEMSKSKALAVGALWHSFSTFMPKFLCQACVMVTSNEKRHYVIQTAFEELGMRNSREIHADMFWDAAKITGLTENMAARLRESSEVKDALNFLENTLLNYRSDEEVLGVLLGLEIPAIENIETIFQSLAHNDEVKTNLNQHMFFRLHREIEIEHVRLTVTNFLRFCPQKAEQDRFLIGFHDGLKFWQMFWNATAETCRALESETVC